MGSGGPTETRAGKHIVSLGPGGVVGLYCFLKKQSWALLLS